MNNSPNIHEEARITAVLAQITGDNYWGEPEPGYTAYPHSQYGNPELNKKKIRDARPDIDFEKYPDITLNLRAFAGGNAGEYQSVEMKSVDKPQQQIILHDIAVQDTACIEALKPAPPPRRWVDVVCFIAIGVVLIFLAMSIAWFIANITKLH